LHVLTCDNILKCN